MSDPAKAAYVHPDRGAATAYERYLRGMDASMRQKVALTAAHLLCEGRIADMGMGSGTGSEALAALYPGLEVIGVDVDPQMVALASERYRLPNLRFVVGDIAKPVFPEGTLDGVFDSSVLHHVTSFGDYQHDNAARALAVQVQQLRTGGVLVVRDFVDPGEGTVLLDVPANDGDDSDDPNTCSTAALLQRFAREFRSLHTTRGFPLQRVDAPALPSGWQRYRLSLKHAAEFVLRKDYRQDWVAEVKEEYTYFTQARFEAECARLGLRVLASTPLWNPWIVRNRYDGRFGIRDEQGEELEYPPTNYIVVGEKVPANEGVRFREANAVPPLGFLELDHFRNRATGQVMDLVRRPNLTIDVVPHFTVGEAVYVLARMSYPRPVLRTSSRAHAALDGATPADYVTEPLNVLQTDQPLGTTVEEALGTWAGIPPEQLRRLRPGAHYYPSPGGIAEEVRSVFVEVEPVFVQERVQNRSGFSTSGRVRAIEARQLLRAAQVGGLPDARLELNAYELLLTLGRGVGPWIGDALQVGESKGIAASTSFTQIIDRAPRRMFERTEHDAGFLELRASTFEELSASGEVLQSQPLEYVVPRTRAASTVVTALLARIDGVPHLGLDDDDLPAAQCFSGHSQLFVTPAWRLPKEVRTQRAARAWTLSRIEAEYGLQAGDVFALGGSYHPSAGATPEVVFPWAVEIRAISSSGRALHWVPLSELVTGRGALEDGHLRIVAMRAAHALGLLPT